MNTTPVSLLQRLRSSSASAEAWPEFVALYTPLLYHWARRLGVEDEDARDLLQDVFLVLVRELPGFSYDPTRRFRGWLWTVFKNQVKARRRRVVPVWEAAGPLLNEPEVADSVQEWQEEEYRAYLVNCALRVMRNEFHATTWEACWAVVVEGRPTAEVAPRAGHDRWRCLGRQVPGPPAPAHETGRATRLTLSPPGRKSLKGSSSSRIGR
jgi:RNA polymerase sigma-70 factor (ECF subfamily)